MFFWKNVINPFPITDRATFQNMDKKITLTVRRETTGLIRDLKAITQRLQSVNDDTPEAEQKEIALAFGKCIFGDAQAQRLMDFYGGDPLAVITACGIYFREDLSKIITKAQKTK